MQENKYLCQFTKIWLTSDNCPGPETCDYLCSPSKQNGYQHHIKQTLYCKQLCASVVSNHPMQLYCTLLLLSVVVILYCCIANCIFCKENSYIVQVAHDFCKQRHIKLHKLLWQLCVSTVSNHPKQLYCPLLLSESGCYRFVIVLQNHILYSKLLV